jgi:hypothetical protein
MKKNIILLSIAMLLGIMVSNAQVNAKLGGTIVAEAIGDGSFASGFTAGLGYESLRADVIYAQRSVAYYERPTSGAPDFDSGSRQSFGFTAGYAISVDEGFRVVPKVGFMSTTESFKTDKYISTSSDVRKSYGETILVGVDLEADLNSNTSIVVSTGWPQISGVAVQVRF